MASTYPECITDAQICSFCYTAQDPGSCADGVDNASPCAAYCDGNACNTSCLTSQSYCGTNRQYIKNHKDVGAYPGSTVAANTLIRDAWTTTYWNSLIDKLTTAAEVGVHMKSNGTAPTGYTSIASNEPFTAALYNSIAISLNSFNTNVPLVTKDSTVISAAIANALQTAYNNATFSTSTCDVCNVGNESVSGTCGCNCSCSCSCPCDCDCDCDCDCPCSCSHPCTCPNTPSTDEK